MLRGERLAIWVGTITGCLLSTATRSVEAGCLDKNKEKLMVLTANLKNDADLGGWWVRTSSLGRHITGIFIEKGKKTGWPFVLESHRWKEDKKDIILTSEI